MKQGITTKRLLNVLQASSCSRADIEGVLREFKPIDAQIRIGADNRGTLIDQNLRSALERGILPRARVQRLIRDTEENSGHHHFYYLPKSRKVHKSLDSLDSVAIKLAGKKWKDICQFEELPKDYRWAGFRTDKDVTGKALGWTATLYGREQVERTSRTEESEKTIIIKEPEPIKVVLVVRWRSHGVLELRVPGVDAQSLIADMLANLWDLLRPAFEAKDFKNWNLDPVRALLIRKSLSSPASSEAYTLGASRAMDKSGGRTTVRSERSGANLVDAEQRAKTLTIYASDGDNFDSVVAIWKRRNGSTAVPAAGLRTVLGPVRASAGDNEVIFSSRANGRSADYVLDQLIALDIEAKAKKIVA